jgi:hypothetical protein
MGHVLDSSSALTECFFLLLFKRDSIVCHEDERRLVRLMRWRYELLLCFSYLLFTSDTGVFPPFSPSCVRTAAFQLFLHGRGGLVARDRAKCAGAFLVPTEEEAEKGGGAMRMRFLPRNQQRKKPKTPLSALPLVHTDTHTHTHTHKAIGESRLHVCFYLPVPFFFVLDFYINKKKPA